MNRAVHFRQRHAAELLCLQRLTLWLEVCISKLRKSGPRQGRPKEGKTMKNFTMQLTIAAAALVAVAGSASAQTYKAEIPMAFHAGSNAMAAGSYEVVVRNTSGQSI